MVCKKENEITKVCSLDDNDYIRATLESGISVQIRKSDLFPVDIETVVFNGITFRAIVTAFFVEIQLSGICTERIFNDISFSIDVSSVDERKNFKCTGGYISTRSARVVFADIDAGSNMSAGYIAGRLTFVYSRF